MSLEQELKTEQVSYLNLSGFCQVDGTTAVRDVLHQMRKQKVNVCLITDGDVLKGIFTDRDVVLRVTTDLETLDRSIESVMTTNPITIKPDMSAAEALWLMDEKKIRNLPVVDANGHILGNMTHQTVIQYLAARYPVEVLNRPPRPDQFPRKQEGGD